MNESCAGNEWWASYLKVQSGFRSNVKSGFSVCGFSCINEESININVQGNLDNDLSTFILLVVVVRYDIAFISNVAFDSQE